MHTLSERFSFVEAAELCSRCVLCLIYCILHIMWYLLFPFITQKHLIVEEGKYSKIQKLEASSCWVVVFVSHVTKNFWLWPYLFDIKWNLAYATCCRFVRYQLCVICGKSGHLILALNYARKCKWNVLLMKGPKS